MTRVDILAKFLEMFPQYQETICAFTPAGPNSIIVEFKDWNRIRFTYFNDHDWSLGRYQV